MIEILLVGFFTFANFAMLHWKYNNNRQSEMFLDLTILFIISYALSGTAVGMASGMAASFMVSVYLLYTSNNTDTTTTIKKPRSEGTLGVKW